MTEQFEMGRSLGYDDDHNPTGLIKVVLNSQGFGPPGPPVTHHMMTVYAGPIELDSWQDLPPEFTANDLLNALVDARILSVRWE